jgi:hypothetical protein
LDLSNNALNGPPFGDFEREEDVAADEGIGHDGQQFCSGFSKGISLEGPELLDWKKYKVKEPVLGKYKVERVRTRFELRR